MSTCEQPLPLIDVALRYVGRGWAVVPVPYRSKVCRVKGWPSLRLTVDDLAEHFNGRRSNIGVLPGEPSGWRVDVDLDVAEAVAAGGLLLPPTDLLHGRASNPQSHYWYVVTGRVKSQEWQFTEAESDKPTMLVELRANGRQTLVPPSVHPAGEPYIWHREGEPGRVTPEDLTRRVGRVAAASLIARHWPGKGSRDKAAMALCGLLVRAGWSDDAIDSFVSVVALCARDEEHDSREKAAATRHKLERGQPVTGAPTLGALLADGERVVATAREWLGVRPPSGGEPAAAWDAPVPLPDLLPPVAPLPPAIIPEPLRAWAEDGAERIGCPLDFIASAAIVVASAIVGRRVGIHPMQWDDWLVVPNLWGMLVGRPSTRKSPGLAEAMRGLGAAIAAEEQRYTAALAVWFHEQYYPWRGRSEVRQEELKEAKKKDASRASSSQAPAPMNCCSAHLALRLVQVESGAEQAPRHRLDVLAPHGGREQPTQVDRCSRPLLTPAAHARCSRRANSGAK